MTRRGEAFDGRAGRAGRRERDDMSENHPSYWYEASVTAHLLIHRGGSLLVRDGPDGAVLPAVEAGPDRTVESVLGDRAAALAPVPWPDRPPELVRVVEYEGAVGPGVRHALHLVFRSDPYGGRSDAPSDPPVDAPAGHRWVPAQGPADGPADPVWRFTTDPDAVRALIAPELHPSHPAIRPLAHPPARPPGGTA
ncbi:hypothetical protein ACFQ6N_26180 [Kitasatospora sp. NPDC056446]|uniref:hypothetical protein n=1 Tax=Kitasatospora sp. NPDC056446 TaxID=3345819 RepID=UPI0036CDAD01